jgi:hypothetical protein
MRELMDVGITGAVLQARGARVGVFTGVAGLAVGVAGKTYGVSLLAGICVNTSGEPVSVAAIPGLAGMDGVAAVDVWFTTVIG